MPSNHPVEIKDFLAQSAIEVNADVNLIYFTKVSEDCEFLNLKKYDPAALCEFLPIDGDSLSVEILSETGYIRDAENGEEYETYFDPIQLIREDTYMDLLNGESDTITLSFNYKGSFASGTKSLIIKLREVY